MRTDYFLMGPMSNRLEGLVGPASRIAGDRAPSLAKQIRSAKADAEDCLKLRSRAARKAASSEANAISGYLLDSCQGLL